MSRRHAISLLCALTLALGCARAHAEGNPYDDQLAEVQARLARAEDAPSQAVLLGRAWRLRDYVSDAAGLERWIETAAGTAGSPLVRAEARILLAESLARRGRFAEADRAYAALGYVRRWTVQAPGKRRRQVERLGAGAGLDWQDFASQAGMYLAAMELKAAAATDAVLTLRSEVPARLWVNDAVAVVECEGECAVGVHLQAGVNRVVVEARRDAAESATFSLRASLADGEPLVLASEFADPADPPEARRAETFEATTLLSLARHALAAERNDARRLEVVAELEAASGDLASAREHMEAAARRQPTTERWLESARLDPEHQYDSLQKALQLSPADTRVLDALAQYYVARRQAAKARDLLLRAVVADPDDFVARKRLADLLAAAGRNNEATAEYQRLELEFPAPLWLRRELAARYEAYGWFERAAALAESAARDDVPGSQEVLLKIAGARRDGAEMRRLFAQQENGDPNDAAPLRELAKLDRGRGDAEAVAEDETALAALEGGMERRDADLGRELDGEAAPYLADAARLATDARRTSPAANADQVTLADIRVERVLENGLSAVRQQEITYLASDEAVRAGATRSVQYSPAEEELAILQARVYKRDGRVLEAEDEGDRAVADASVAMYYDVRAHGLRFPALEKGDVVELDYRLTPTARSNPYGSYFGELRLFRGASPRRLQRWVLITPADRRFAVHEERMPAAARVAESGGLRVYDWQVRDTQALSREPRGPAATEVAPYVHVSTFGSWQELGRWYAALVRPQFALDGALREALGQTLAGKRGDLDKVQAIRDFVLRNTHYVAFEFGVFSYKPYPVAQVYARRFGDCKDKAALMIALLRAAGIEADLALVRTRSLGPIAGDAASISVFNHAIAYLPQFDLWLDGTAEYAGLHELPLEDQGAMALTVSLDGEAQLRWLPASGADDNFTRRAVRASVERDGSIRFAGTAFTRGEDAPGMRREYESPQGQREAVRTRLAELFTNVRIDDVNADTALERDVNVNFRGRLDTFTGHPVVSLAATWTPRSFLARLAPLTRRSTDLVLPAAWSREELLRIELPRGAEAASLPPDTTLDSPFGSARLHFRQKGREVTVETRVEVTKTRIAPGEYPQFREFCFRLERAFQQEVTISLRPKEARR